MCKVVDLACWTLAAQIHDIQWSENMPYVVLKIKREALKDCKSLLPKCIQQLLEDHLQGVPE